LYRDQNRNLFQYKSKIVGAAWKALLPEDVLKWTKEAFKINVGLGLLDQDDLQDFIDGKNLSEPGRVYKLGLSWPVLKSEDQGFSSSWSVQSFFF